MSKQEVWKWVPAGAGSFHLLKDGKGHEWLAFAGSTGRWYVWNSPTCHGRALETTLGEVPNTDEAIERASIEIKRQLKLRGVEVEIRRRK